MYLEYAVSQPKVLVVEEGIEPPFDWIKWLTENWYIPAGAIAGLTVLALLWPREPRKRRKKA